MAVLLRYLLLLITISYVSCAYAQSSDSLRVMQDSVQEVVITAFNSHRTLLQTAGAISILSNQQLQRNNNVSLQNALNTVPGVRMQSRGLGGSPLLSIRGSMLRDPFAVRNIKVYWNNIPLTAPDGTTTIEVIDPMFTSSAEIIKGPGSSLYGSGTGGVILFNSIFDTAATQLSVSAGSYGMFRSSLLQTIPVARGAVSIAMVHQQNDGYREQEANRKDEMLISSHFRLSNVTDLSISAYLYNGYWGLPGGLTQQQVKENPRQAVVFSQNINARLARTTGRIGIGFMHHINSRTEINELIFTGTSDKENPYGTSKYYNGYKFENTGTVGARLDGSYHTGRFRLTGGAELQAETDYLREHENLTGTPGNLKSDYTTKASQVTVFAQAEATLPQDIIATVGASYNYLRYVHQNNDVSDTTDHSGNLTFRPDITPRFALVKTFNQTIALHGSISYGFSQPDVLEVIAPDGSMNTTLRSESGINYEIGTRLFLLHKRLTIDASAYIFHLTNAILPYTDSNGYTIYHNSGQTLQKGLEAAVGYTIISTTGWLRQIHSWCSIAFNDYRFKDYIVEGTDFSNQYLPGVPLGVYTAGLDIQLKNGFYTYITYQYNDRTPLNNGNTAWQAAYQLLDVKTGYPFLIGRKIAVMPFAGINNLLNAAYTSFFQLNDASGRYFNPEPGINYYGGLSFKWKY